METEEERRLKYKIQDLKREIEKLQAQINKQADEIFKKDCEISRLAEQNQSLQTKLQQAKEGLEFYEQGKHIERTSYPDIGNNTKCIKLLSTGDYLEVENGLKAREKLEIINKE